jgi:TatD DNase family protein
MLVDSHCHLDFPALAEHRDQVIQRARTSGIDVMQTIATRLSTFDRVLAIAQANAGVFCSVGVHPHHADEEGVGDPDALLARTADSQVIGIGESGLDYYYQNSTRAAQERSFRAHIDAARQSGLPLIVHTRDADADTIEILGAAMREGPFTGVIHCYSSGPELGFAAVEMGLYLGLGGILTFKRSDELRATVKALPIERLILETDAPYLAPQPVRGKTNEPAYVTHVVATLAEVKGLPVAEVARVTTANFFRLFSKAAPAEAASCA